jgi:hypothetical protein
LATLGHDVLYERRHPERVASQNRERLYWDRGRPRPQLTQHRLLFQRNCLTPTTAGEGARGPNQQRLPNSWLLHPAVNPLELAVHPLELAVHPLELAVHPLELAVHPLELAVHPSELAVHPLELAVHPLELAVHPLELAVHPLELAVHPLELAVHPLELAVQVQNHARS